MINYIDIKKLNRKIKDIEREEHLVLYYEQELINKKENFQATKDLYVDHSLRDIALKREIRKFYITKS